MQIIVLIQSNHNELGGKPTPSVGVVVTCFLRFVCAAPLKTDLDSLICVFPAVRQFFTGSEFRISGLGPGAACGLHGRELVESLRLSPFGDHCAASATRVCAIVSWCPHIEGPRGHGREKAARLEALGLLLQIHAPNLANHQSSRLPDLPMPGLRRRGIPVPRVRDVD